MGRNIVLEKKTVNEVQKELPSSGESDNYASQIVKLIPAEIVGVYLGLNNLFSSLADPVRAIVQTIFFIIIILIAPAYLKKIAGITDNRQRMVAIISYCIWCISLGGPFTYALNKLGSPVSAQMIGGGLIMLYTLIVPLLYKSSKPDAS